MTGAAGVVGNKFAEKWTDEKRSEVMKMWDSGMSYLDIARRLGVTRNSISGIIDRYKKKGLSFALPRTERDRLRKQRQRQARKALGLPVRPPRKRTTNFQAKAIVRKAISRKSDPVFVDIPLEPSSATNVTLMDLPYSGACKFPVGQATGSAQLFCGSGIEEQHVYCRFHELKAWRPKEPTKVRKPVSTFRAFGEART